MAVSKDGDPIGNSEDFFQAVRDIYDRHALLFHTPDDVEQRLCLSIG